MSETVLITGDAGAIGSATAERFLGAGMTVLGLDLEERRDTASDRHHTIAIDVTDEDAVEDALRALEELPALGHVVAIAGGALPEEPATRDDPWSLDLESFRASVERNLTSQFTTIKAAFPWLRRNDSGNRSITLTSSFNALSGQGMPAYSAAKAGLIGLMYGLVTPLGSEGIRINTVAPGTVRTPRTEEIWADVPNHFERLRMTTTLGRLGRPDDLARVYAALALDMTHVTGQVLVVDGGQLAGRQWM